MCNCKSACHISCWIFASAVLLLSAQQQRPPPPTRFIPWGAIYMISPTTILRTVLVIFRWTLVWWDPDCNATQLISLMGGPPTLFHARNYKLNPCVISNLIYSTHTAHMMWMTMIMICSAGGERPDDLPTKRPIVLLLRRPCCVVPGWAVVSSAAEARFPVHLSLRVCVLLSDLRFVINARLLKRTSSERFTAHESRRCTSTRMHPRKSGHMPARTILQWLRAPTAQPPSTTFSTRPQIIIIMDG